MKISIKVRISLVAYFIEGYYSYCVSDSQGVKVGSWDFLTLGTVPACTVRK